MTSKKKVTAKFQKPGKKPTSVAMKTAKANDTPKKPRIGILIADDHSVLRQGLVSLIGFEADMMVVGEASNGREAVDLWKKHRPDVMLLDLRMPELDGVGVIKQIRAEDENTRIIVLTTFPCARRGNMRSCASRRQVSRAGQRRKRERARNRRA